MDIRSKANKFWYRYQYDAEVKDSVKAASEVFRKTLEAAIRQPEPR